MSKEQNKKAVWMSLIVFSVILILYRIFFARSYEQRDGFSGLFPIFGLLMIIISIVGLCYKRPLKAISLIVVFYLTLTLLVGIAGVDHNARQAIQLDEDFFIGELANCKEFINNEYLGCIEVDNSLCKSACESNVAIRIPDVNVPGINIIGYNSNECLGGGGLLNVAFDDNNATLVRKSFEFSQRILPKEYCIACYKVFREEVYIPFGVYEGKKYGVGYTYCPDWVEHAKFKPNYFKSFIYGSKIFLKNNPGFILWWWFPPFH